MNCKDCPFDPEKPVRPFSNGTEAMVWRDKNCDKCINYESESKTPEEAKCKLAYYLDLGYIVGAIPLWVAKDMGCDYNPLYGSVTLWSWCTKKRTGDEPF